MFWALALPTAAVTGLVLGLCALAGARTAVRLTRATTPRSWQWRQMFALCVAFSTLLLSLPPGMIAAVGYVCALLICPPLDRAIADVTGRVAS